MQETVPDSPPADRSARRLRRLSRFLLLLGVPALVLGAYGIGVGLLTLTWPRAEATILDSRLDTRRVDHTVPGTDKYRGGRLERRDTVHLQMRYRYRVGPMEHEATGIEPADFGLLSSTHAHDLVRMYPKGARVDVAYHPRRVGFAYLRPGPSSPAVLLALVGGALVAAALWARRRSLA